MAWVKVCGISMNEDYLREVSEEEAVKTHPKLTKTEVVRAWKKANGKSKPKPREDEKAEKID